MAASPTTVPDSVEATEVTVSPRPLPGRFYKSRKSRPCDCCRKRKVVCDMPKGPPCRRCSTRDLPCTFVQGPGERKRKRLSFASEDPTGATGMWDESHHSLPIQSFFEHAEDGFLVDGFQDFQNFVFPGIDPLLATPGVSSQPTHQGQRSPLTSPPSSQHASHLNEYHRSTTAVPPTNEAGQRPCHSLENLSGAFSFYIGPTGAADIHLLSREQYDGDEVARPRLSGLRYRRLTTTIEPDIPVIFGITDQKLLANTEPRVEVSVIEDAWNEFWDILEPDTAWRLIQLFSRFIEPCFPIIASQQLPSNPDELCNMPLGLLAALCASALPFVMHDESLYGLLLHPPSSQRLYRLCWLDISQQFHSPTLTTLQACLLLQQRLPTNPYLSDTAFSWTLISSAVSVAQTVGLHRDPSPWESVPQWERKLRRRLWWVVWTMEKWVSLTRGMPSHIHDDDFDVSELTPDDIEDTLSRPTQNKVHICELVQVTRIMADIHQTYYTTRAIGRTAHDLQHSLDLARSARARLKQWRDQLPPASQLFAPSSPVAGRGVQGDANGIMNGIGAVYLSYIITHMTLFRALLRPLDKWSAIDPRSPSTIPGEDLFSAAKAVVRGSILCVKEFVEMLESMTAAQWNGFWHSWSRQNFAIGGSFMVHLLHITSASSHIEGDMGFASEDKELRVWIGRWRTASRACATGAAGAKGLANLGLLRVEIMLARLLAKDK